MARKSTVALMSTSAPMAPAPAPKAAARDDAWSVTTIRLPVKTYKELKRIALDKDTNLQLMIENALAAYLLQRDGLTVVGLRTEA